MATAAKNSSNTKGPQGGGATVFSPAGARRRPTAARSSGPEPRGEGLPLPARGAAG